MPVLLKPKSEWLNETQELCIWSAVNPCEAHTYIVKSCLDGRPNDVLLLQAKPGQPYAGTNDIVVNIATCSDQFTRHKIAESAQAYLEWVKKVKHITDGWYGGFTNKPSTIEKPESMLKYTPEEYAEQIGRFSLGLVGKIGSADTRDNLTHMYANFLFNETHSKF